MKVAPSLAVLVSLIIFSQRHLRAQSRFFSTTHCSHTAFQYITNSIKQQNKMDFSDTRFSINLTKHKFPNRHLTFTKILNTNYQYVKSKYHNLMY